MFPVILWHKQSTWFAECSLSSHTVTQPGILFQPCSVKLTSTCNTCNFSLFYVGNRQTWPISLQTSGMKYTWTDTWEWLSPIGNVQLTLNFHLDLSTLPKYPSMWPSCQDSALYVCRSVVRGGPIFCTGFSILSAKWFRWVGGPLTPVRKDCWISKTRPLKKHVIHENKYFYCTLIVKGYKS